MTETDSSYPFGAYTDRQLIDNMLDRAAGLSWRMNAEAEMARRGYTTRDDDGHLRSGRSLADDVTAREPVVRDPESWQAVAAAGRKYA